MTKKQILLSSITTLALLLGGCSEDTVGGDTANSINVPGDVSSSGDNTANTPSNDDNTHSDGNTHDGGDSHAGGNTHDDGDTHDGENNAGGDNDSGNAGEGHIPPPGDGADIPIQTNKTGGWYGRTVVSATAEDGTVYSHSTAGVFGELVESNQNIDSHDIPSFGTSILRVVFPQDDGVNNGDYFSNYQSFSRSNSDKRSWTFQIKNQHTVDLKDAAISITLPEVHKVKYKKVKGQIIYDKNEIADTTTADQLTLIDVDNAKEYTVAELQTANLNMDGLHTRTFRWVLGTVEEADYVALDASGTNIKTASFDEASLKTNAIDASFKIGGKFGLPPQ